MISNLIDFGRYLVQNNQEDYGFHINEEDIVLYFKYDESTKNFKFTEINKKSNINFNFYNKSYFKNNLPTPLTTQNITISNQAGLMGFSPFVLMVDHDFLGIKIKPENYSSESPFREFHSERYKLKYKKNKSKLDIFINKIKLTYEQNKMVINLINLLVLFLKILMKIF